MKIEEFKAEDYGEVYALWAETGISLLASDEYAEIVKFQQRNGDCFLVGRDEKSGKIIAVCLGGFDGRRGYIYHLAVKPEFQGRGYGREILDRVMDRLKQKGVLKVHLFIELRNPEVIGFYESSGWTRRNDLIMMSKALR
jgi:N-acetylglutamate synthase